MEHGAEVAVVVILCFALTVGAAMRMLSTRLGVPYTIAMLLVGIATGLLLQQLSDDPEALGLLGPLAHGVAISPELIIFIFLPILIFESAFAIEVHAFRKNLGAVLTLAGPAVLASTGLIAVFMVWLTSSSWQWGWLEALVFGGLISATDPVAVVAMLREMSAPKRLGLLIEGESLFNDGTAIVIFTVLLGLLTAEIQFDAVGTLVHFVWVSVGGLGVGVILAIGVTSWLSRVFNAPLIEITLTVVLAYLVMLVGEGLLHVSGILGVVAAGLWMAGRGRLHISPEVTHFLHRFWEMLAYLANTLIFFLVGLVIATQIPDAVLVDFVLIVVAFAGIVALRVLLAFLFRPVLNRVADPISAGETTVMAWGGLRGAVSLALALVVSQHPAVPDELGGQILLVTAGVVLLTLIVNGSTIGLLLQRLGFDRPPPGERLAELVTRASVLARVGQQISNVSDHRDLRTVNWAEVKQDLEGRQKSVSTQIDEVRQELESVVAQERTLGYWRQVLSIERQAYWSAFAEGTLGPQATRLLDNEIDQQLDRLARGDSVLLRDPSRYAQDWRGRVARWLGRATQGFGKLQFEQLALRYDLYRGEQLAAERVLTDLESRHEIDADVREQIREAYRGYLHASKERLEDLRINLPEVTRAIETHLARRIQLNFERGNYEAVSRLGAIDSSRAAEALANVERHMKELQSSERQMELPATSDLCRNAPVFAALDDEAIEAIAAVTIEKALSPGELLFRQGDRGQSMFIIARGALEVVREDPDEEGVTVLDVLGGGDIIGEMALLTGAPRLATARAMTTITVGEISRRDFDRLMATQPGLREGVWQAFGERAFDNHLRGLRSYDRLSRDDRIAWFRRGRLVALDAGEQVPVDGDAFAFVVDGGLERSGEACPRPSLLPLQPDTPLRTTEETRVAMLPPLFELT